MAESVAAYYRDTEEDYRLVWGLERNRSIHYGYWDRSTWSFRQALQNTNKVLSELASIKQTDHVLDAGCGVGGSSLWLAKNIGCSAVGITLSPRQVALASKFARRDKVSNLTKFLVDDYTSSSLKSKSFDVVWAVESVCYAEKKEDFLKEAKRLLRKNGRLVMTDFFRVADDLTPDQERHYRGWADGWVLPDFEHIDDFRKKLEKLSYKKIKIVDATMNILPLARRLYVSFFIGAPIRYLQWLFKDKNEYLQKNLWAAYHQYKALKKGVWKYYLIYAEK